MDGELHEAVLHLSRAERPRPTVEMLKSGVERNGIGTKAFSPRPVTGNHLVE